MWSGYLRVCCGIKIGLCLIICGQIKSFLREFNEFLFVNLLFYQFVSFNIPRDSWKFCTLAYVNLWIALDKFKFYINVYSAKVIT